MKLVIEVRGDNAGTRMEFEMAEAAALRIRANIQPSPEEQVPGWWSMLLEGENVYLVISDAKERREP